MVTILVNTLYTSAYATENGKLTSYYGDGNQVSAWDGKTTEFEYYYDDYTVSFILESYWDTGYNLKVRIKNISEYDIHNWYLAYDSSYPILKIWNAEIYEQNNNYTIIKFDDCTTLIGKNSKQKFTIDELVVISILNNEGAKFYLDEESSKTRETIFEILTERESRYYQRQGVLWWVEWKKVSKGAEKGFFKGTVYSEADLNLSLKIYQKIDFRDILDATLKVGAVVFTFMIAAEVLPIVVANTQALVYYVKTFGVVQGIQMYKYLGIENLPNGVISWLQMDMADGDSSLDDLVDKGIPIYKRGQTGEEYLKKNFPGESQQYFETYVDGVKYGRYVDMYSDGIAYEAKVGYTCLSKRIKLQVLKDAYLIEQNKVDKVVWVFFRSEITGKLGASRQLIELLNAYNIEFLFID